MKQLTLSLLALTLSLAGQAENVFVNTPKTTLMLSVDEGHAPRIAYYGARLRPEEAQQVYDAGALGGEAYPAFGRNSFGETALSVTHADGNMTTELATTGWRREGDVVYSVGRKMADAMRRDGFPSPEDLNDLAEHPAFARVADLVEALSKQWEAGKYAQVLLVYNHFVSTARQEPVAELLLDADSSAQLPQEDAVIPSDSEESSDVIIEPSRKELLKVLLPKTRKLKLYAALLDSSAAEHAARTVAMQTATDNGENLLQELTLQYNKGRQQKITSEILDLAGGQAAE